MEVCNAEIFKTKCDSNEVVVIQSALHGRMNIGRCVKRNLGYLGCKNDATDAFDEACSGKNECAVTITNDLRKEVTGACGEAIVGYAEVTYDCLQGKSNYCLKTANLADTYKTF